MIDYYDEGVLANDWHKEVVRRAMRRIEQNQEDFLYTYGELGDERRPMLRYDFVDKTYNVIEEVLSDFTGDAVNEILNRFVAQDIDLAEEVADWYNEYNWVGPLSGEYIKGKVDPRV